ncbi:hypothetical protein MTO96_008231 [Rhipicephalus appendiculatus]
MRIRQPRPARRVADWSPRRAFGALGVYSSTGGGPNRAADEHLAHSAFARSPTVARTVEPTKCRRSRQRTSGRPFSGTWQPLVKGFGVTSTVSPVERKVRRLCDEVAEEDARPTPLSVELVGVVRPVRPSVFATGSFQASSGSGETVVTMQPAFHFPWTPDEKGAFKKVSSAAGVIGCVDGSVAVIIAPKGDHHKAASYCCKKHYADIVMLTWESCREPLRLGSADDACVWRTTRLRERFEGGHGLQRPYLLGDRGYVPVPWLPTPLQGCPL